MLLQLVLVNPRLVSPPLLALWVNALGTGPCPPLLASVAEVVLHYCRRAAACSQELPIPSLSCHALPPARDGDGDGDSGCAAGRSLRLLFLPLAALGATIVRGTHIPGLRPGARRAQSPWAGWQVTPSQLLTPRWWGWGPRARLGEPPPHSFCLRVCLSGRAGAACALSANAAPCFLMLMLL